MCTPVQYQTADGCVHLYSTRLLALPGCGDGQCNQDTGSANTDRVDSRLDTDSANIVIVDTGRSKTKDENEKGTVDQSVVALHATVESEE